ncbi:tetratricopeptide repeat protein [Kiritimatiellota bacterium B12222]|nr:tetratricopeptide repeat protein [Kiritimatiellota bacterium B12222]
MINPPAWVPGVAVLMLCFWVVLVFGFFYAISSDRDSFFKNFVSTYVPSSLGEKDEEINFLDQQESKLNLDRAERYNLLGVKALDQLRYPEAQVNFKIAIQSNPVDPELHFNLAKSYLAMGQMVQGEMSIKKTLELNAEHVDALLLLAELMERRENRVEAFDLAQQALALEPDNLRAVRLNAGLSAANGDKETTRRLMDQLYAQSMNNVDILTFLGRLEMQVFQDVETAKARIDAALAIDPDYIAALLVMIQIYGQEQNGQAIEATLARVLELDPENIQALRIQADMILSRYGIGAGLRAYGQLRNQFGTNMDLRLRYAELLLRAGKISEGKYLAEQLTQSRVPQYERAAYWMLAQMYSQVRMHREAVENGRHALRLTPNGQNIHLFLSQQLIALNELNDARREAEFAFTQNPNDMRAVNLLTQVMVMQGEEEEAVEMLDRMISENPEQDNLRMRRIEILMQSEDWLDALADTRLLNEKYPDNAALRNNLAFLLARSGEGLAEADALSLALVEAVPDNPIILDTRAYVLAAQGKHAEALAIYELALSKASDNVVIRYHYALSLVALGREADALPQVQAVLMINPSFPQAEEARVLLETLRGEAGA